MKSWTWLKVLEDVFIGATWSGEKKNLEKFNIEKDFQLLLGSWFKSTINCVTTSGDTVDFAIAYVVSKYVREGDVVAVAKLC